MPEPLGAPSGYGRSGRCPPVPAGIAPPAARSLWLQSAGQVGDQLGGGTGHQHTVAAVAAGQQQTLDGTRPHQRSIGGHSAASGNRAVRPCFKVICPFTGAICSSGSSWALQAPLQSTAFWQVWVVTIPFGGIERFSFYRR